MPMVFYLVRLKPGVDPAAYERWFRERDFPMSRKLPSIISYTNHKLAGPAHDLQERLVGLRKPDVRYDYLEVIHVTDLAAYRTDVRSPAVNELRRELMEFIDPTDNFVGEVLGTVVS